MSEAPLRFQAARTGVGPLTWGQIAIWDVFAWLPPGDASLNLSARCDVPAGADLDTVRTALRVLVERHDSLRSVYYDTPDGPRQEARGSGEIPVEVHRDADEEEVAARLVAAAFDNATDLPLRVAVLCRDDRPVTLLLALNHMALDGWSLRIVLADLDALLAGAEPGPAGQQPLERAAYEASAEGRQREAKALAFWSEQLAEIPDRMIASVRGDRAPDFVWARIESPALALATRALAIHGGVAPSVVLLAASSLLLAAYAGESEAALRTIVATRFHRESRDLVGAFNQNALFRLGIADESVAAFLRRAVQAALNSYWHCEYHPRALDALVAAAAERRGITPDGYCFFNDVRFAPAEKISRRADPAAAAAAVATIPGLLGATRITGWAPPNTPKGANLFLYLHRLDESATLALCVERGFLEPRGPADFLGDLERLVTMAALGEDSVRALYDAFRSA